VSVPRAVVGDLLGGARGGVSPSPLVWYVYLYALRAVSVGPPRTAVPNGVPTTPSLLVEVCIGVPPAAPAK
jgi:hypothetical protein